VAVLDALEELVHLQIRQVVTHALTENQAHAIAHLLIGGIQFRLFRGFGGCGTAGHEAGHCQCKERFLHCIIL